MLISVRRPLRPGWAWSPTPTGSWCGLQCLSKLWYGCTVGYDRLQVVPYFDGAGEESQYQVSCCCHFGFTNGLYKVHTWKYIPWHCCTQQVSRIPKITRLRHNSLDRNENLPFCTRWFHTSSRSLLWVRYHIICHHYNSLLYILNSFGDYYLDFQLVKENFSDVFT